MKHIPRKRFGQHFLADVAVIDDIVRAIRPRPGEALVEIGPGLGALTQPLLERCGALTVIELDQGFAGPRTDGAHDVVDDGQVGQEMLAEALARNVLHGARTSIRANIVRGRR